MNDDAGAPQPGTLASGARSQGEDDAPRTRRWLRNVIRGVLPASQRRNLDELHQELDLAHGDRQAKTTAFWSMLVLSGVIAAAGVLADSVATVIGAMIIAPLSTPIMGIALGVATSDGKTSMRSAGFVLRGMLAVVVIGIVFSLLLPESFVISNNSQISSRTSPGVLDLIAAVATGLAGAIALSRKDVAAVLPGVAISISLVPPLAVIGVCLGRGAWAAAVGGLMLFLSNALALVLAGAIVFAAMRLVARPPGQAGERVMRAIWLLFLVVGLPLVANSVAAYYLSVLSTRAYDTTSDWLGDASGAFVTDVDLSGNEVHIDLTSGEDLPDTGDLLTQLDDVLPDGMTVILQTTVGRQSEIGTTGATDDGGAPGDGSTDDGGATVGSTPTGTATPTVTPSATATPTTPDPSASATPSATPSATASATASPSPATGEGG